MESIERTGEFLAGHPAVEGVDLLPFHRTARDKHRKFGVPWLLESDEALPDGRVRDWAARLDGYGFPVTIGGSG